MRRIKIEIAYDGSNYCGWQIQINGTSVEEVINAALSDLLKKDIKVIGASRTDSGVHALGNIAVFDTDTRIPTDRISYALNQRLPKDIQVQSSTEVDKDFHPRYIKNKKTYQYKILNRKFSLPTERLYSYLITYELDLDAMKEGAAYLVGKHDYKSFCSGKTDVKSTVRTIYSLDIDRKGDMVLINFVGDGFLYNMIRIIVGTLIKVGRGAYPPDKVKEILMARDRSFAGPTAPAMGLMLVSIDYNDQA